MAGRYWWSPADVRRRGQDLRPCWPGRLLRLTCRVFIGAEIRLEVGFYAALARMANLSRGGLLRRASDAAYQELGTGLARVGPLGAAPGMSRLVQVRLSDLAIHEDSATWAVRWEAAGRGGVLFPALDADIKLTPAGQDVTILTVTGVYRPPLGGLGAGLDRAIMHRVAQATIRTFTHHIGSAIAHPAAVPDIAHTRMLPEFAPGPEPGTV